MPVLIAAQQLDLDIARAVARRLTASGGEVRCYLEDDDYELRDMGCKIAVGLLDDAYNLAGALTNVHTFMPLLPDALTWSDPAAVEAVGTAWASAAAEAEIEQTILALSALAHGAAIVEAEFERVVSPLAVIRTRMVVGEERPLKQGNGWTTTAVEVEKLAEILANADDREHLTGRWALDGWPVEVEDSPSLTLKDDLVPDNSAATEFGVFQ